MRNRPSLRLPSSASCVARSRVCAPRPRLRPARASPLHSPAPARRATARASVATTPDEPFRAKKPEPLPTEPAFTPPSPVERKLKNGAQAPRRREPCGAARGRRRRHPERHRPRAARPPRVWSASSPTCCSRDQDALGARFRHRARAARGAAVDPERAGDETVHLNALKDTLPDALALHGRRRGQPGLQARGRRAGARSRGSPISRRRRASRRCCRRDAFERADLGRQEPLGSAVGRDARVGQGDHRVRISPRFTRPTSCPNNAVISVAATSRQTRRWPRSRRCSGGGRARTRCRRRRLPALPSAAPRTIRSWPISPTASQSQVVVGWRGPKARSPGLPAAAGREQRLRRPLLAAA